MAPPVAEPPPLPDGVKEGMKACSMKLKGYFRIYNPERYTAEMLASNKKGNDSLSGAVSIME